MKNSFKINCKWLCLKKNYFRLLVAISVLADDNNTFVGTLNDLFEEINLGKSSGNKATARKDLAYLETNEYITVQTKIGNEYTITFIEDDNSEIYNMDYELYRFFVGKHKKGGWISMLKVFIVLDKHTDQDSDILQKPITYSKLAFPTDLNSDQFGRNVRSFLRLQTDPDYPYKYFFKYIDREEVADGIYYTKGNIITKSIFTCK